MEPAGRFRHLIDELLAEHDREIQILKQENKLLHEQLNSVDITGCKEETERLQLEIRQLKEDINRPRPSQDSQELSVEELGPLREEATQNSQPEPPKVMIDLPRPTEDSESDQRQARIAPGPLPDDSPQKADLETDRTPQAESHGSGLEPSEHQVQIVRAIAYTMQIPSSALPGDLDPAELKLVVSVRCGEMFGDIPAPEIFQKEVVIDPDVPNQINNDVDFGMAWGEEGGDVLFHVPQAMLDSDFTFDVSTQGSGLHVGSGVMTLNCRRRQWSLDCGGFLEGEVHMEKATTPAGQRRTSTTTRARIIERLEKLFDVKDTKAKVIMPADLGLAMHNASKSNMSKKTKQSARFESRLAPEDLDEVMMELKRIHMQAIEKARKTKNSQPVLSWSAFVECMLLQDLPKFSSGHAALHLFIVQRELLGDEMPATGTSQALLMAYEKAKKPVSRAQRWVNIVTALSTAAIIVSFAFMGISLDTDPDWIGWIFLDGVCAVIFVAEVVVKSYVLTPKEYFFGRDWLWNLFDVGLSFVAVSEIILSVIFTGDGAQTRAALALRGLRVARAARLAKLMRMPLLEELANLISGFVLSVRSLFWVMIFLFLIVYIIALGFRAGVQTVSESTTAKCGHGDYYNWRLSDDNSVEATDPPLPPGCLLHYMYGVEFCGSVFGCMFSIFRCMISECTSKGGRSLTMIFSDGFGLQFDMFYAASMVVVLFGLFNIITAIFVEATLNGLKENEVQRRYAKAYESNYMTEQLAKLVMTVSTQVQKLRSRTEWSAMLTDTLQMGRSNREGSASPMALQNGEIYLSEEEFNQLVRHPDVRLILNDLDVSVEPRPGIFEAFSTESDGTVSLSELVSGLMRLRGDLHKVDMVIAQMSLDHMQKQLADMKKSNEGSKCNKGREKGPVKAKVLAVRSTSKLAEKRAVVAPQPVSLG